MELQLVTSWQRNNDDSCTREIRRLTGAQWGLNTYDVEQLGIAGCGGDAKGPGYQAIQFRITYIVTSNHATNLRKLSYQLWVQKMS